MYINIYIYTYTYIYVYTYIYIPHKNTSVAGMTQEKHQRSFISIMIPLE